jgi:hypothetical protein
MLRKSSATAAIGISSSAENFDRNNAATAAAAVAAVHGVNRYDARHSAYKAAVKQRADARSVVTNAPCASIVGQNA